MSERLIADKRGDDVDVCKWVVGRGTASRQRGSPQLTILAAPPIERRSQWPIAAALTRYARAHPGYRAAVTLGNVVTANRTTQLTLSARNICPSGQHRVSHCVACIAPSRVQP